MSTVFISLSGAFQGDSLSGCLFTLTLAGALIHLRAVLDRPNPPISDTCLPLESEYADDVDFLDEDLEALKQILPTATSVLKDWSLNVNEQKTEFVRVYLAGKNETDSFGAKIAGNEPWRSTKLLGSLLCSTKDILHRIQLGNVALANFRKIWLQGRKISLKRKLLIYEAQVISVLMYGSCSWAAPKHILEKLNICHRRHLRSILNVRQGWRNWGGQGGHGPPKNLSGRAKVCFGPPKILTTGPPKMGASGKNLCQIASEHPEMCKIFRLRRANQGKTYLSGDFRL